VPDDAVLEDPDNGLREGAPISDVGEYIATSHAVSFFWMCLRYLGTETILHPLTEM